MKYGLRCLTEKTGTKYVINFDNVTSIEEIDNGVKLYFLDGEAKSFRFIRTTMEEFLEMLRSAEKL